MLDIHQSLSAPFQAPASGRLAALKPRAWREGAGQPWLRDQLQPGHQAEPRPPRDDQQWDPCGWYVPFKTQAAVP